MVESKLSPLADESVKTGTLMPLVSLRKHLKISLYVSLAIILLGVPFAWLKGKSFYSATAVIYIAPRTANILHENKEQEISSYQQYKQFLDQQAGTITRYEILLSAFKRLGDLQSSWKLPAESERRAVERLQSSLVVKPVNDTYLISVTLESDKAEGLENIVNTVVETYVENAHEEQLIYASKERMEVLYDQRRKLQEILAEKKKNLASLAQKLSITVFVDNAINPYDQLLADTQLAYAKAQRDHMAASAALELFENPKTLKTTPALDAAVSEVVYKDQGLFSLKANMYQRRSELVRQISGLDPQHPGYQQIKKQLERIEDEVVEATNQLTTDVKHMLVEDRRSKVALSERIETDLLTQITEQKNRASWFSTSYNDALSLNQEIKRFYEQLESVDNRISFLELESKAPGFIHIESPARPPEIPIRGGRKKLFIMAFVLSILAFFGIPIVIDMLDKRIKTAGQVEKLLGYKPLTALVDPGQKSEQSEEETARMLGNQMRHLVLTLERERSQTDKPYSLIMLTAVEPKSAVTSLALNLAMDYRKIDVPVIVVEVNSLTPDQRYLSKPNAAGLLNVAINDELSLTDVINPADHQYPDRIAIGTTTTELLFGYHRIEALLAKIAETYPVIILDTAPILNSADTEFFASISDITLLLIAAKETKPDRIKLAVQLLERIDPKVIGFVVTRLEIFIGGWRPILELLMSFLISRKQPFMQLLNRLGKK